MRGHAVPRTLVLNKSDRGIPDRGASGADEEGSGMRLSDKCRVDDCDRQAAATMIRDTLPGPLRLCATHTEDFRMNSDGWTVAWEKASAEPTSVKTAGAASVGRGAADPATQPQWQQHQEQQQQRSSLSSSVRTRLASWRNPRP